MPRVLFYGEFCSLLYCVILNCIVLYCTVLYYAVLYSTVLYCTLLYKIVLYCIVLYCTALYCTVQYSSLFYFLLFHNNLPSEKLSRFLSYFRTSLSLFVCNTFSTCFCSSLFFRDAPTHGTRCGETRKKESTLRY